MKQNILDQRYLELLFCESFKNLDFWSQFQKWNIEVMPTTTILPDEHNKIEVFHFSFFPFPPAPFSLVHL